MKLLNIFIGVCLIGIAIMWFLTPYGQILAEQLGFVTPRGTRGGAAGNLELINMLLNAANVLFGAVGVYLTLKASRR